jgi:hypothetical protein
MTFASSFAPGCPVQISVEGRVELSLSSSYPNIEIKTLQKKVIGHFH